MEERKLLLLTIGLSETEQTYLKQIYLKNRHKMFHIALSILRNKDDAEDAVQEAFLSLSKYVKKFEHLSQNSIDALCVIVLKNKCIDTLRKNKKITYDELEVLRFDTLSNKESFEENAILNEEKDK